jgi:hypothetical protein
MGVNYCSVNDVKSTAIIMSHVFNRGDENGQSLDDEILVYIDEASNRVRELSLIRYEISTIDATPHPPDIINITKKIAAMLLIYQWQQGLGDGQSIKSFLEKLEKDITKLKQNILNGKLMDSNGNLLDVKILTRTVSRAGVFADLTVLYEDGPRGLDIS